MDPEQQDAPEVLETPEQQETVETPIDDERDAKIAQLEAEKADLESKNKQLFERTKKQKEALKQDDGLTNKDVLFLAKTDVHEEDMEELIELAKLKKIPVSDAYKQFKPLFDVKAEERRTAAATQTRGSARGSAKLNDNDILDKAERGETLTTDEEMNALFKARRARAK